MEINSVSNQKAISEYFEKRVVVQTPSTKDVDVAVQTNVSPATIVTISDPGLELVKKAIEESRADVYVEKSDEEYARMSFEELIDERNGGKDVNHSLDKPNAKGFRFGGKADFTAQVMLGQQMWELGVASQALTSSLKTFKESVYKAIPEAKNRDFDISIVDGKETVVSKSLSKEAVAKIQKMLDDKDSSKAIALKRDIATYNQASLKMINMRIYEERGTFGDKDSPYVHREDPLSMKEFTDQISYNAAADSGGGAAYQKYSDIIGSTKYGVKYIYKSSNE